MTPREVAMAQALAACTMLPGHPHKRFAKNMGFQATHFPEQELTAKQKAYLDQLAYRYRRQMPAHLVPSKPDTPTEDPIVAEGPTITVIDVARAMNVELEPSVAWSVGAIVRAMYEKRHGELPEKALRQKTSGGGSHCFAVYGEEMRPEIEKVIRDHMPETARQGSLF